ncbi:MAG: RNA polymerase sporulation sigma factor SigK [bacterium]|uniref:RNA polymerase sporulation sigma factor SigK n=1 Tax=Gemmiger sp. TaxID=2049027 RepID=UPI003F0A88B7|nr:RNA polymerase sporulation sigma factor SigK [bacterium]MDD6717387.1 RNA polymerase sporulation sigma factor SigK [bacterium]
MKPLQTLCRQLENLVLYLGALPDLYYINGPDTLPPPLTPQQEKEVFAQLAAGVPGARDTLITHNLRLVVYIAKKFESSTAGVEDMISIGTIGLIKAVNTFEPDKNIKLATYASRCIENEILMYLRKSSNRRQDASIDEPLNTDSDGNELLLMDVLTGDQAQVGEELERNAEHAALLAAVNALAPRERQIMEMRFGLRDGVEHTQKEVADAIGISQSYISRLEKRIIKRLRREIESLV